MAITEARIRANRKYNEKAYDRIELKVTKGKKADLQTHASNNGESLNRFVNRAIDETVKRDGGDNVIMSMPGGVSRRQIEAMQKFREAIRNCNEPVPEFERIKFREAKI